MAIPMKLWYEATVQFRIEIEGLSEEQAREKICAALDEFKRRYEVSNVVVSAPEPTRRKYCNNCGVAMDVGGGCGVCKPIKAATKAAAEAPKPVPVKEPEYVPNDEYCRQKIGCTCPRCLYGYH